MQELVGSAAHVPSEAAAAQWFPLLVSAAANVQQSCAKLCTRLAVKNVLLKLLPARAPCRDTAAGHPRRSAMAVTPCAIQYRGRSLATEPTRKRTPRTNNKAPASRRPRLALPETPRYHTRCVHVHACTYMYVYMFTYTHNVNVSVCMRVHAKLCYCTDAYVHIGYPPRVPTFRA